MGKTAAKKPAVVKRSAPIKLDLASKSKKPLPPSKWPAGVAVSRDGKRPPRPWWLPPDWAVGVRTTCRVWLPQYISPEGVGVFHRSGVEAHLGYQISAGLGSPERAKEWALARLPALEDWQGKKMSWPHDSRLFALLTKEERAYLPKVSEFHVAVVSARRATEADGIQHITTVEVALRASGCTPIWYVDAESLSSYKALGLDAVVGGKLTPARNMALNDAARCRKACLQVSDDITRWEYWDTTGQQINSQKDDAFFNKLAAKIQKAGMVLSVSPSAVARFILAKMRACGAKLGGVYPNANAARAIRQKEFTFDHFILGDFFVADRSAVRFDNKMSLKEDYDFTCAHLAQHGKVIRCNRLMMTVKHSSNAGGAVSIRDEGKEQENIQILIRKWPGAFRKNPTRPNEVVLNWSWGELSKAVRDKSSKVPIKQKTSGSARAAGA